jgi:hypothetical protein
MDSLVGVRGYVKNAFCGDLLRVADFLLFYT